MKKSCFLVAALLAAAVGLSAENVLTDQEKADGWVLLFDGVSGKGWHTVKCPEFPAKGWVIQDGTLTITPNAKIGDLITDKKYTDFMLKVDFKLTPKANSGIKYFFDPSINKGTTLEFQVLDPNHPDAKNGIDGNRKVGSFYDVMPAPTAKLNPVGEWNTAMIVSKGTHVEHWLNGAKVVEFDRGSEAFRAAVAKSKFKTFPNWGETKTGHILLQDHNDQVSYRNLKIKELK